MQQLSNFLISDLGHKSKKYFKLQVNVCIFLNRKFVNYEHKRKHKHKRKINHSNSVQHG